MIDVKFLLSPRRRRRRLLLRRPLYSIGRLAAHRRKEGRVGIWKVYNLLAVFSSLSFACFEMSVLVLLSYYSMLNCFVLFLFFRFSTAFSFLLVVGLASP